MKSARGACNTCRGNPHLKPVWNAPSHELLHTNYCTPNLQSDCNSFSAIASCYYYYYSPSPNAQLSHSCAIVTQYFKYLAHRNRGDFCDLRLRCPLHCIAIQGCDGKSLAICDFELRFPGTQPILAAGILAI